MINAYDLEVPKNKTSINPEIAYKKFTKQNNKTHDNADDQNHLK